MAKRDIIHELARKNKIRKIYVFGSCARKEETPESDIDFLTESYPGYTMSNQADMQEDLENVFKCKVDVVSKDGLHIVIRDGVLKDAIEIL